MIEPYMHAITDAARIVKAGLPPGHGFELADLVSIGAERVLRYIADSPGASSVLAFVCAKQGMLYEARRWSRREPHGYERKNPDPIFVEFDEQRDVWDVWRRASTLNVEDLIDAKRALLAMQLREAVTWYSHHWLGEELGHLETEFGVCEGRIRQYAAAAREKLAFAWRGVMFETEEDRAQRERTRIAARDVGRAKANSKMLAERRQRYAELRKRGFCDNQARRGAQSKARYLTLCRHFTEMQE